jgi:hypothetical protein
MSGKPAPEPTTVINAVEHTDLSWVFEMAELGIVANYFVTSAPEAQERLANIRTQLGL